jgi:hypothetical protein
MLAILRTLVWAYPHVENARCAAAKILALVLLDFGSAI